MDISELTINPQLLEENGYRSFQDPTRNYNNPAYKISYQKRFDDEFGKKYFINFSFTHYTPGMYGANTPEIMSWEADVQLNTFDGATINLTYFGAKDHNLTQVEKFFDAQFNTYLYEHYEYNYEKTKEDYLEFIEKQKIKFEQMQLNASVSISAQNSDRKVKAKI